MYIYSPSALQALVMLVIPIPVLTVVCVQLTHQIAMATHVNVPMAHGDTGANTVSIYSSSLLQKCSYHTLFIQLLQG